MFGITPAKSLNALLNCFGSNRFTVLDKCVGNIVVMGVPDTAIHALNSRTPEWRSWVCVPARVLVLGT